MSRLLNYAGPIGRMGEPASFLDEKVIAQYKETFLFYGAINHIMEVRIELMTTFTE